MQVVSAVKCYGDKNLLGFCKISDWTQLVPGENQKFDSKVLLGDFNTGDIAISNCTVVMFKWGFPTNAKMPFLENHLRNLT